MDQQQAEAFIEKYRVTFEAMEPSAIANCFAFPCHVVSDAGEVSVMSVPSVEAWTASIERIVGAYRALGVTAAVIESLQVVAVTPGTAHAIVHWDLRTASGARVYGFTASYTLIDTADAPRIAGIVHDEGPRMAESLAALRSTAG